MARHKNLNWNLPEGNPTHRWDSIHAALLMDIRDELQRLNALLHCPNFTGMPAQLRKVARNTSPPPKKRVKS